eukprot:gene56699-biopygen18937
MGGQGLACAPYKEIVAPSLGDATMLFRRFYAGSAVCSPTRASVLSGRTPQRSCIDSAEGGEEGVTVVRAAGNGGGSCARKLEAEACSKLLSPPLCGQKPAWSCYDHMPFPPTEFTVATAAKSKGYATMFVGKWHLGDFWAGLGNNRFKECSQDPDNE